MSSGVRFGAFLLAGTLVASVTGARLEKLSEARESQTELLFLPNGKYLKVASLGQAPLLADLIYLWAIQYYANYDLEDRTRYVEHVFGEVVGELDPYYTDAYWLGALILILEGRDLEAGLRLLDRGIERNPDGWMLPYLAGWECATAGQLPRAIDYFDRAAAAPDAPGVVLRTRAGMAKRSGNLREALLMWGEVLDDPRSDDVTRAIAERQVRDLTVRADLEDLEVAIVRFRDDNARYPRALEELLRGGYLERVPLDPDDNPYVYDPQTGEVSSTAGRLLGKI